MQKPYEHFDVWPALPILRVYAAWSIAEAYFKRKAQECPGVKQDIELYSRQFQAHIRRAEARLITWLCARDLDTRLLADDSLICEFISEYFENAYPDPEAEQFVTVALESAVRMGLEKWETEEDILNNEVALQLHAIAVHRSQFDPLGPKKPKSIWQFTEWLDHFSRFPTDEFRLPVLHAIDSLKRSGDPLWTSRMSVIFGAPDAKDTRGIFTNTTAWYDTTTWDKYDDDEEQKEPWQA